MNSPGWQNGIGAPLHARSCACICAETWQFDSKFWADDVSPSPPLHDKWFIGRRCRFVIQRCCTAVQFSLVCTLFLLLLWFYLLACFTFWQVTSISFYCGQRNFWNKVSTLCRNKMLWCCCVNINMGNRDCTKVSILRHHLLLILLMLIKKSPLTLLSSVGHQSKCFT